ncbi:hypothetical protein ATANTOWER_006740, partial [Ataeniobius toweri]|nr:hypothetical protein [Ataeniobius toweri]
ENVRRIGAPRHSEESNTQQRATEGDTEEEEYTEDEKDRKETSSVPLVLTSPLSPAMISWVLLLLWVSGHSKFS